MTIFIINWFSVIKLPISQSEVTTHPAASRWRGWSTRRWIARPYRRWAASRYPCRGLRAPGYTWGTWGQSYGSGSWAVPAEQPGCPPALLRPPATQHLAAPSCPSSPHKGWKRRVQGGKTRPEESGKGCHSTPGLDAGWGRPFFGGTHRLHRLG